MKRYAVPERCDLDFAEPILCWDEAIPLGSGLTGCLVYGDGAPLKFALDRGDLWDCRPAPEVLAKDYTYETLIQLVKEGKQEDILRRFDKFYEICATPTKLPAGKVQLIFKSPSDLRCHLSLQRAEAVVTLTSDGKPTRVSAFLSAKNHFGYLKVEGDLPEVELLPNDFTPVKEDSGYSLTNSSTKRLGYPAAETYRRGSVRGFTQVTNDGAFALLYATKNTDFGMEGAFYVASSRDGDGWLDAAADALEAALCEGYDRVIGDHLAWWEGFWNKSALRIPDPVLEKNWYLSHYYLGSCSRKGCPPMPLQGVWTADKGSLPPWKGDYHGDLNLQFSYYSALKADHLEECESFLDFFTDRSLSAGRKFAEEFFDTPDGICLPSVFAFDGTSLGGWPMYATNIVNQIWELHVYYQYYKYTADEEFLQKTLLPLLIGAEKVVRRWLCEDEKGWLTLPLSSSPEVHNNDLAAWLPSLSTNDLALLRFLYATLEEVTGDGEYGKILARLPDYPTDERGYQIYEGFAQTESHRHFSHLMQAYPLDLIDWADPTQRDLVTRSVENLIDLGPSYWVGFSFTWLADLCGRLGDGKTAAKYLRLLTDHLYSVNGFHLNGDYRCSGLTKMSYRPFTLETNMMFAESVQEMLMQCYDGVIRVFPAVPEEWLQNCSFEGFLAFGNVKVSASARDGAPQKVTLTARRNGPARIFNPFTQTVETYPLSAGESVTLVP